MHTCFSSSVSTFNQVFQKALFGVLPGIFLSFSLLLSLRCPLALFGAGSISLFVHDFSTSWSLFSFLAWVLGWCCVLYRKKVQVTIHLTSISIHPIDSFLFFPYAQTKRKINTFNPLFACFMRPS